MYAAVAQPAVSGMKRSAAPDLEVFEVDLVDYPGCTGL
jgi:hypothetical protein